MATDTSLPGPHIDLVPEMVRWWDRWLRDEHNGVDEARRSPCSSATPPGPSPTSTSTPALAGRARLAARPRRQAS